MRYYRDSINIMSGWDKTCRVDICRRVGKPVFFQTKTYHPKPASAERFRRVINQMLRSGTISSVQISMVGNTLFIDIEG